jgi:predicted unusual protein kinase regulating ubiquinone biosynthesis (AarF/ABC1/UbiB family)
MDNQKMLNFRDLFAEFKKTCLQEINYKREAEAADHFYEQYKNHPQLVIPKTYLEFCTPKVIVQQYIQGLSVTDLLAYKAQGIDPHQYVKEHYNSDLLSQLYIVGYEIMANAVVGNLLQADPHPGNVILLQNNKVAMIDFGMTTQLVNNRLAYYEMGIQYQAFYTNNIALEELMISALKFMSPKLYKAMTSAGSLLNDNSETSVDLLDKLRKGATTATQDEHSRALIEAMIEQKQIMKILFFAVNRGNRFGFTLDLEAIMLLKAHHAYMTLMAQFDPEGHTIARVLTDVTDYARQNMQRVIDIKPMEMSPHEAVEILSTWFDKMARNDPWLMEQIAGEYIK